MIESLLTNTSTEGLKPLGTAPQRSYELVSDTVRQRLGDAHAALFAEPVATQYGDRLDWYAPVDGKAVPLSSLEDDTEIRTRLDGLVQDIKGASEELLASNLAEDQRLGEALANALEIPDEESIFVIEPREGGDPQPVLVNWAWTRDEQVAVRGVLTGKDNRAPEKRPGYVPPVLPPPGAAAGAAGSGAAGAAGGAAVAAGVSILWWWLVWLGWLLLALLIASVIYLMIEPCSLRLPFLSQTCAAAEAPFDPLAEERGLLEDQIAQVQREIGIQDRLCQPDFAQLPIPDAPERVPPVTNPPPTEEMDAEVDERADAAGAQRGDLTFTLIWEGTDDLDLHTTCPSGDRLFYNRKAVCNGTLDVDMNGATSGVRSDPVENAFFTDPLTGEYQVRVNLYSQRESPGPVNFTLQIRDGERVTTQRGQVAPGSKNWQYTYRYGG